MMTKHLAVVLISNTEAHLVIIVQSVLVIASVSDRAECRKHLCHNFEGVSSREHVFKCAKVHRIIVSLSPIKDNSSGSVRYFGELTVFRLVRFNMKQ